MVVGSRHAPSTALLDLLADTRRRRRSYIFKADDMCSDVLAVIAAMGVTVTAKNTKDLVGAVIKTGAKVEQSIGDEYLTLLGDDLGR